MKYLFTIILIGLFSCQTQTNSEESKQESEIKNVDSVTVEFDQNSPDSSKLAELETKSYNSEIPLSIEALKDFEKNGANRAVKLNDSLFAEFLKSFTTFQNNMNNRLYDDPKYDTYNTLIYADEDLIEPEAKELEDSIQKMGFYVSISEGMIFLEKDPKFLNKFSEYLSEPMNSFRIQYSKEIKYPLATDGGIIISTEELIQRMMFWEKFAQDHTDFELPNYANDQFEMYLFYLMFGMDNTPIHDWSDSLQIRPDIIATYNQIIEKYPNSKATEHLKDYLRYIEQKDFKYDHTFNEYGRRKFRNMYEN